MIDSRKIDKRTNEKYKRYATVAYRAAIVLAKNEELAKDLAQEALWKLYMKEGQIQEEKEEFYLKVKGILETEGEVSNAIGRLTDKEYFETLSYEEKQRYTLSLSEKYLQAVERYRKEMALEIKN